jgi:hypothetical protein
MIEITKSALKESASSLPWRLDFYELILANINHE